ncbi:ArdC-like ssDNA-binding domain-containing protein [Aliarcobacter butzleri]|uniref:ArdC-like ssDNA-binding domain-containing protein n=1 Tax=Aliarcobacter butzleri TaxID=28197 RepID=UPI0021B33ADF|nr:ArdC-like ssDNA-binding domain-containing protein [Aliarcobacter butzleri]MCT7596122.1 ArdC-like ssDNA-binding domain-containing protein [Aliarcobacter butzleri]
MANIVELYLETVEEVVKGISVKGAHKPINGESGREYKGLNSLILFNAIAQNRFDSNKFYSQASLNSEESAYEIKTGEKGIMLFSSKLVETGEVRTKKNSTETYKVQERKLSYYYVFNENQIQVKKGNVA